MNNGDSWEKLELDARKHVCEYYEHQYVDDYCQNCRAFLGPVECAVQMAMELVDRAKVLAGVEKTNFTV